jgi:uncharacterized cupin superfamily protein
MTPTKPPLAIAAAEVPPRPKPSNYPAPFALSMRGREKRALGEFFGLKNFGVNLTHLAPGARSALRHAHSKQDEIVYILSGSPTLVTDEGETPLAPGMCAGFKAGTGNAHHLLNPTAGEVLYLEVGDRGAGDVVTYPDDDLQVVTGADGTRRASHKDGTPY